jgi:hypothetical protein
LEQLRTKQTSLACGSLQDPIYEICHAPRGIEDAWPVGDQAARLDQHTQFRDCGNPVLQQEPRRLATSGWDEVMLLRLSAAALLLALGACTVGPSFEPPDWLSPTSWFAKKAEPITPAPSIAVAEPIDPNWWNLFKDPVLTGLERRVAGENLDVQIATVRIAESRAQLGVTGAAQFPTLNANGSYARQKASDVGVFSNSPSALGANGASGSTTGGIGGGHLDAFDVYQVGFDASWEVDLWGRVRRSVESATASVVASAEARRDTLLSSLAELARDYIQLRGTQSLLAIARDNVRIAQQNLQLTQQRATGGVTTDLDVANAAAQLRTTAAEIPRREQQESEFVNAISLLLGQPPNALQGRADPGEAGAAGTAAGSGRPAVGVGAAASRHPPGGGATARDDRGHRCGVANFYPSVKLSGSLGLQALQPWKMFNIDARNYAVGLCIFTCVTSEEIRIYNRSICT